MKFSIIKMLKLGKRLFSFGSSGFKTKEIITVLGYGSQGRSQSLNMRDQNYNVILGLRQNMSKETSWNKALSDGWVFGKNLFDIESATKKGTIVHNLLSDTAQIETWDLIKNNLRSGSALSFSHGLGIVYGNQTGIIPQNNIDIFMVAPKGVGPTVRTQFINGKWINSSWAVHQDATGHAKTRCLELAKAIGCGHVFPTTFEKEVHSDLTGERGILMGGIQGFFKAQFDVLVENGHSPEEAFNETVEEALESLYPLISKHGMDHLYRNCSAVAQRGALDWAPKFEAVVKPVIQECYKRVKDGKEMERVLEMKKDPNHREKLELELKNMDHQLIWKTGKYVRSKRTGYKPLNI